MLRIHKFGHACLLIEGDEGRILVDPGGFSQGFEEVDQLNAVLITHAHGDHLNVEKISQILERNPSAVVAADEDSTQLLVDQGISARAVSEGETFEAGLEVRVIGSDHAVIHPELPRLVNHGYFVGGRVFHPGDALTVPEEHVEVLALPIGAPWLKSSEFIEYLREVRPDVAVPIHDAVLAVPGISHNLVDQLGPPGVRYEIIDDGESAEFD